MKKGFTLIELLVVVLIIGILAAIALPQYTKAVEKSRATEAMQLLGTLANAEWIYMMQTGHYTNDLSVLDISLPGVGASFASDIHTNNYKIEVTSLDQATTFKAAAQRANSSGVPYSTAGDDKKYAIIVELDANGSMSRYCGADKSATSGDGSVKMCRAIANNSTGVIQ
ncbi:MAG: prepilin-type N-terminal cleavage/methylation domain-containing protein [Elusimicrobiaceae bacterium]|nr:prepilin-type N-terminal cleavage/methylation domain-containing protein [Elusimicrobiaceae bacterium]